jgi:hypothetical protein
MTLKVDEERQQLFPFCAFFYHFAAQTAVWTIKIIMTLKPSVGRKVVKRQRLSEDKRKNVMRHNE